MINAIQANAQPPYRNRAPAPRQGDRCFFHHKHRERAHTCIPPCSDFNAQVYTVPVTLRDGDQAFRRPRANTNSTPAYPPSAPAQYGQYGHPVAYQVSHGPAAIAAYQPPPAYAQYYTTPGAPVNYQNAAEAQPQPVHPPPNYPPPYNTTPQPPQAQPASVTASPAPTMQQFLEYANGFRSLFAGQPATSNP